MICATLPPESLSHVGEQAMSHVSPQPPRIVTAPPPSPATMHSQPYQVMSVVLEADEDVEWTWVHTMDGVSYVNGYTITKKNLADLAEHEPDSLRFGQLRAANSLRPESSHRARAGPGSLFIPVARI